MNGLAELIRKARETSATENNIEPQAAKTEQTQKVEEPADQKPAESKRADVDELAVDGKDEDEDRNKRYVWGILKPFPPFF